MFRTVLFVALAGLASAQIQISQQCKSALTGIVADSSANSCLSPTSLIPLATSNNTSIVGPIGNWTQNVCSAAPCSNQTLANIVNSIVNGCQSEITGTTGENVDPSTLASRITPMVQQYYPTVRKLVCLKDNNNNCLTQSLQNIESITGPLSLSHIMDMIMLRDVPDLPANITCTDCTKAAYNILHNDIPDVVSDTTSELQQRCNASFTDGTNPPGISIEAAGSNNTQTKNGAMALVASGLGVSALTVVSAVVALI